MSELEIGKIFFLHLGSIAFHYFGPLHYCILACSASLPDKLKAALSSEMRALHLAIHKVKVIHNLVKTIVCFLFVSSRAVLMFLHTCEVQTFHFAIG